MAKSDQNLAQQAQRGDREAFRQLLEAHYSLIFRVAYKYTGHRQDAEDVAQEVCIRLADKIGSFRGESSFSSWLYRVVVNACRDLQRKQGGIRSMEKSYREYDEMDRANDKDTNAKIAWLYRAIAGLEPTLKETALLVLAENLSHAEAGEILDCAESTVSWRMHEIRKQLKATMDKAS